MTTLTATRPARIGLAADRKLWTAILVLTVIGIGVAGYLTIVHYGGFKVLCVGGSAHHASSCTTVQSSTWSKLDGIPVALLGLIGYVTMFALVWLRGELARAAMFAIALIGCLFSLYLTYREVFTIKAICEWCVSSAVIMTVLMVLTAIRALRDEPATP
jgi:uncharacterized membrane protein